MTDLATNVLYYGDNLDILRRYLPDAAVDLVYLDPPFNSNRDYNVIFRDESGNATGARRASADKRSQSQATRTMRLPTRVMLAAGLMGLTACTSPTSSASPTALPGLTATPTPTASFATAADWFGEVSGWDLVDAPAAGQEFEDLANAAVAGLGFARVQAAAEAIPSNGSCCAATVIAFAVAPDPGHDETELFRAVVDGLLAGVGVDPQPACDGQAVSLQMGEQELILGPFLTGPYTIFLVADGPSIGASRAIFSDLQGLPPGSCVS